MILFGEIQFAELLRKVSRFFEEGLNKIKRGQCNYLRIEVKIPGVRVKVMFKRFKESNAGKVSSGL